MQQAVMDFLKANTVNIIWIVLLFLVGRLMLQFIVGKLKKFAPVARGENASMREKRAHTLGKIVINIGNVIIYGIMLLMILSVFGIDMRPVLAGVGILGVAVGFGAQTLVKDCVSGLFILAENQYNIGDRIKVSGFEGVVEKITLRSTVLREDSGGTVYIPNGSIANVVNASQRA